MTARKVVKGTLLALVGLAALAVLAVELLEAVTVPQ